MRQEVDELWNCSIDNVYRRNRSSSTESTSIKMTSPQLSISSSPSPRETYFESSESSSQDSQNQSHEVDKNFLNIKLEAFSHRRKISDSSDASSVDSKNISPYHSTNCLLSPEHTINSGGKFDEIIEKIGELKFSGCKTLDNQEYKEFGIDCHCQDDVFIDNINNHSNNSLETNDNNNNNTNDDDNDDKEDDDNSDVDNNNRKNDKSKYRIAESSIEHADGDNSEAERKKSVEVNDSDSNDDDNDDNQDDEDDDDDEDLRARGPVKHKPQTTRTNPPYKFDDWLENASGISSQDFNTSNIDSTARLIFSNQNYRNAINPCLDRLEFSQMEKDCVNSWNNSPNNLNISENTQNFDGRINQTIPGVTLTDNLLSNDDLIKMIKSNQLQSAQRENMYLTPASVSENWPDSPASLTSFNTLSSRPHSRTSSRAHSSESPIISLNITGSSPTHSQTSNHNFRVPVALSSSSSSNHSFGDTPSPSSYQYSIEPRIEEQLENQFDTTFSCCSLGCESSATITNSSNTISFDLDNDFQINELISNNLEWHDQVVPKQLIPLNNKSSYDQFNEVNKTSPKQQIGSVGDNQLNNSSNIVGLGNTGSLIISAHNDLVYSDLSENYGVQSNQNYSQQEYYNQNSLNNVGNDLNIFNTENSGNNQIYINDSQPSTSTSNYLTNYNEFPQDRRITDMQMSNHEPTTLPVQNQFNQYNNNNSWNQSKSVPFNNFQIPETVSSFKLNHSKRNLEKHIAPWPCLNLPRTQACQRLRDKLDPKEVEKAMKDVLKKSNHELAVADEDGDTMLMCLVGSSAELERKKAYLVPLVERLGTIGDGLSRVNNRKEDALYLAAINCPQMPEVTGYLGAVMIKKGIDINRLYRGGNTLIHAVVAHGDTHVTVLAELLALKTSQGNSVFDLSTCNYDGKTPLHVAVETHDPLELEKSALATVQLLLENGADPKIHEFTCGNTPLHLAVSLKCDPMLVKVLLSRNGYVAVNIPNLSKNTALHMAAAVPDHIPLNKQMEVCASLISAGGLTNVLNQQGKAPLALVSTSRKEYIRKIFRKKY